MLSTMLGMLGCLTIIISVYCCIRLMEMMSSNAVSKLRIPWALLCAAGIAIIIATSATSCIATLGAYAELQTVGDIFKDADTTLPEPLSRP